MALTAQIALSILAHETSSGDLSRTLRATPANYALTLADGTGDDQAQVVWSDSRTASTTTDTLSRASLADVRDGSSATVSIDTLKLMYIRNNSPAVTLNVSASAGWYALPSSPHRIRPGGVLLVTAPKETGYPSTGVGDSISVSTSAGTAAYDIVLVGAGGVT